MTHQQQLPCPPPWWQPSSPCLDEVTQFQRMLQQMIDKTVDERLKCLIQQGTLPPGIVDGSEARPGQVGEFITGMSHVSFAASPNVTDTTVSPLVVPPGDWDLWATLDVSTIGVGWLSAEVTPLPVGLATTIYIQEGLRGLAPPALGMIGSNIVRGNFTVPTLLNFRVIVDNSVPAGVAAGTADLWVDGRRRR